MGGRGLLVPPDDASIRQPVLPPHLRWECSPGRFAVLAAFKWFGREIRDWFAATIRTSLRRVRRLNFWVGLTILALAGLDFGLKWKTGKSYLDHHHLILVGIGVVILFFDRFREFKFGSEGLTFKARAEKVARTADELLSLQQAGAKVDLARFFSGPQRFQGWGSLILFRITLRLLLKRLCLASGLPVTEPPATGAAPHPATDRPLSMTLMLSNLQSAGELDATLAQELGRIRDATYFSEWGGAPPALEEIEYTLRNGPRLLERLHALVITAESP